MLRKMILNLVLQSICLFIVKLFGVHCSQENVDLGNHYQLGAILVLIVVHVSLPYTCVGRCRAHCLVAVLFPFAPALLDDDTFQTEPVLSINVQFLSPLKGLCVLLCSLNGNVLGFQQLFKT